MLHEGVIYRHIILTVPAMFRTSFYQNAAVVLSAFMRCGGQCLDDFYSTVRGKALRGGYITVLHTHGRDGQYHPHLHLLATSGGYDAQGARWEHLQFLPYELLRRKWQWHLLTMLRQTLKTEAINQLVDACFTKYPQGLVTNVQKGQVPSASQSVAGYVAKYVVSPPIAVRRIDRYDGERVTYHYRSHRTDRMEYETVAVATFIGRMMQHTMPKGFNRTSIWPLRTGLMLKGPPAGRFVHGLLNEALDFRQGGLNHALQLGKRLGRLHAIIANPLEAFGKDMLYHAPDKRVDCHRFPLHPLTFVGTVVIRDPLAIIAVDPPERDRRTDDIFGQIPR